MTRFLFGGGPEDVYLVVDPGTGYLKAGAGAQALFYADNGKTQRYTDLTDLAGQPITAATTESGSGIWSAGQIAPLYGPDNVTEMYVSVAGSPPYLMQASAFGSWALPLLIQVQQLLSRPTPALANLADVNATSLSAAVTGNGIVKLADGSWGAGTVGGGGGGGTGDATLAGAQTFTGAKSFSALLSALGGVLAKPLSVTAVAQIIQALAGQSGNLSEWRNSGGTALSWVDYAGNIYTPNGGRTYTMSKTGTLAIGVGTARIYNDTGTVLKIRSVRASIGTAGTANTTTFDVKVSGSSIYSAPANRPSIAVGSNTSGKNTGFTSGASIPDGGYITTDVVAIGTGAADAVVQVDVW